MKSLGLFGIFLLGLTLTGAQDCPWDDPDLVEWTPGQDPDQDLYLDSGSHLLSTDMEARTLTINYGAKLVIANTDINIRVSYILIHNDGAMYVGDHGCPFTANFDLTLWGRMDDDTPEQPAFGRKFIGVANEGTLMMVGPDRLDWTTLTTTLEAGSQDPDDNVIVNLKVAHDWQPGEVVVIASTSEDMNEAEEFTVVDCPECTATQAKLNGVVDFTHLVVNAPGISFNAEIGLLSRDIKVHGEMEADCYGTAYLCDFYDYDTYGGHIQMLIGYTQADFVGVELYNMGQQFAGNYPIHYHRVRDIHGTVVIGNSIHHTFSRCVTIHAADGILVEDNVGYDSLGHCYFLEDGNEQLNNLTHNLGLLTKPALILPSDRDAYMCTNHLPGVWPGHVPDPDVECMGVSTFWLDHPNNYIESNVAAGSDAMGFFFVFHREPTGPSVGDLPPYHGERSQLGSFRNNVAHSNQKFGLIIDRGVKIDGATEDEPEEFLALQDYARWMPHENHDPLAPRIPAHLHNFNAYRNYQGAFFRGGDVWMHDSLFTDNDIGLTMASEGTLPYDAGAHQHLDNTVFVGHSGLRGRDVTDAERLIGFVINDGPVEFDGIYFWSYDPQQEVETTSIGFQRGDYGQNSPANMFGVVNFDAESIKFDFEDGTTDGDDSQIFYDRDGDVAGTPGAYVVRNNGLMTNAGCTQNGDYAVCTGVGYAQVYVTAETKTQNLDVTVSGGVETITFEGANKADMSTINTNYQPVLLTNRMYEMEWSEAEAPDNMVVSAHNMPQGDYVVIGMSYPGATDLELIYDEWMQMEDEVVSSVEMSAGTSVSQVINDPDGLTYFLDVDDVLYFKLLNRYPQNGWNYCSAAGCQRIHIHDLARK
jgi:cell migration-inducing and hyaluronan-binding protein